MKYCQHEDTGLCCCVCDNIELSRRHIEITKQQYDLHEGNQQVANESAQEYIKNNIGKVVHD